MKLTDHFKLEEFACACGCGEIDIESKFIERLEEARKIADTPFVITSGFRCQKHNKKVGGKPSSAHLKGQASDIGCIDSLHRWAIVEAAIKAGFKRIGIGNDFIHLDSDDDLPAPRIWIYG